MRILRSFANVWPRIVLPPRLTNAVAVGSLLAALLSGMDYLALPDVDENGQPSSPALTWAEAAAGLNTWGWLLIAAVVVAVLGWIRKLWPAVILAHMLLAGIYAAFGISGIANVIESGQHYGWRTGSSWLLVQGVLHFSLGKTAWVQWDKQRARIDTLTRRQYIEHLAAQIAITKKGDDD